MCNDLAEAMKALDGKKCLSFFPSNAFMASARLFNTLYGIAKAVIQINTRGRLLLRHKRELVKDLYIVQ